MVATVVLFLLLKLRLATALALDLLLVFLSGGVRLTWVYGRRIMDAEDACRVTASVHRHAPLGPESTAGMFATQWGRGVLTFARFVGATAVAVAATSFPGSEGCSRCLPDSSRRSRGVLLRPLRLSLRQWLGLASE